ncbi:MAG: polyphosphate kinase 2 family protein [Gammaproteobacteria bacterium]|nr:polyphosphate kinase 2 family protein [Gammaproteobacteria bacterium]
MDFDQFRVKPGTRPDLSGFSCRQDGGYSRDELKDMREAVWKELDNYQEELFAEGKQSLLVVLQAMDAAGKDSTIAKLTGNLIAHGCNVHSFKKPTKLELAHDFLWRVHYKAPAKGGITLFNRSHYEDVLIVKVHNWASEEIIDRRYDHINNFESLIADSDTKVIKFMLHITPEYQLERFKQRLSDPEKYWKFNPGDLDERALWADYMAAFETALERCSTEQAPWYVVPAENRRFRDLMVASVMLQTLKEMDPRHPEPDFDPAVFTVDSIK